MSALLQTLFLGTLTLVLASNNAPKGKKLQSSTVLALLNAETETQNDLPFSNGLEEDLLAVNKKEMDGIATAWRAGHRPIKEENLYFQNAVEALNAPLFKALAARATSPSSKNYREAARTALQKVDENSQIRPENVLQFKDGDQIGFCFGRALYIHYWLLKEGVPQSDIAKVFAIGELHVGQVFWNFHVAVWIKDAKDGFIVVDPLQKGILSYKEWIRSNANYDIKAPYSRIRFYMTSPRKFLPSFGAYSSKQLQDPHFKDYFKGLQN